MQTKVASPKRYSSLIIILHWSMAAAIFMMLISGAIMTRVEFDGQFELYQIHKSVGVLLLLALLLRMIVRAVTKSPPIPNHFPRLEQLAAKAGHAGLYLFMAAMVISGWVMVSSSVLGLPTIVFGWFEWPHLPFVEQNEATEHLTKNIHFYSAIGLGLLLAGHIGAVIKHRYFDHENLIKRLWWEGVSPVRAVLSISVALSLAFFVSTLFIAKTDSPDNISTEEDSSLASSAQTNTTQATTTQSRDQHAFILDKSQSNIAFSGLHEGDLFEGSFQEWDAEISFNPDGLDESYVRARFKTESATTGNMLYDGTLPEEDWFDVENHPEAVFESQQILPNSDGSYQVQGSLTMKNISRVISFDVQISDLKQTPVSVNGMFSLNRLDFQIGVSSDPEGEWVSTDIDIQLGLFATKAK